MCSPAGGIIVFLFAELPYLAFLVQKITGLQCFTALMNGMPNYGLFSAIFFGLIGAFFSRLLALQGGAANLTVEDAQQMFKTSFVVVRAAVGMIGADHILPVAIRINEDCLCKYCRSGFHQAQFCAG